MNALKACPKAILLRMQAHMCAACSTGLCVTFGEKRIVITVGWWAPYRIRAPFLRVKQRAKDQHDAERQIANERHVSVCETFAPLQPHLQMPVNP
jgi:hypothetical protein